MAVAKSARKVKPARQFTPEELEIRELVALCKAGKLFQIQQWIADGKRINPPRFERKGPRPENPLTVAIDRGFHSLAEVLLKAGAEIDTDLWNGPMGKALQMRRFDLVQLLVEHGYDATSINMSAVFHTWDPEIVEFFIDRGADVETDGPLAEALRQRIRSGLRVFKRYQERFPHFQKQIDSALRYHCQEGNAKWVSLLLWAGADPYSRGGTHYQDDDDDDDGGLSALGFAALYERFDLFKIRGMRLKPDHPELTRVLKYAADHAEGLPLARRLIQAGVNPNDQANGGCSAIQSILQMMSFSVSFDSWGDFQRHRGDIDSQRAREGIKGIHFLVKHGARWHPKVRAEISDARRSLVKLIPDYTLELVWIMARHKACTKESLIELVRTPRMKSHLAKHSHRLRDLLATWEEPVE
jgi:hypothetical protein